MNSIPVDSILVSSDRQRQHFDQAELDELAASITQLGILQPPVVRSTADESRLYLVAGERRLRAMQQIIAQGLRIRHGTETFPAGHVPFLHLGEVDTLSAFESELHENLRRANLTWQEQARAEALLHQLRGQQAAARGEVQTLSATATEVLRQRDPTSSGPARGDQVTAVATRVRLAEYLADPEVAKAKSEGEALKIVRKKQEAVRVAALAETFQAETVGQSPHTLLRGDARAQLATLPSDSVDCLLTDPPYGIDADTFGEQSGAGHAYQDSESYFNELIAVLAEESYRVCKPQAHAYVFCDPRRFNDLQTHFELAGWKVWPIPLIWAKGNGMLPRPEHAPRRTYEAILFAAKGDKTVRVVKADVISISSVRDLKHGAQKPVDLYVDLLSRSVVPGDTVLDAFAGSGTIFPAANQSKVRAIGIELSDEYANIALARMMSEEDTIAGLDALDVLDM